MGGEHKDEAFLRAVGNDRLSSRHVDELIGLARGLCADRVLNVLEVEVLQTWLANALAANDQPLVRTLFDRVSEVLSDDVVDGDEQAELFQLLDGLCGERAELGEVLKPATLPLCNPAPPVEFDGRSFAFTGTFAFGQRKACEQAVAERGGSFGAVTRGTDYLVIGSYVTESWKHSSMGTKVLKAVEIRDKGHNLAIIAEAHWRAFL